MNQRNKNFALTNNPARSGKIREISATAQKDKAGRPIPVDVRVSRLLTGRSVKSDRLIVLLRDGLPVGSFERVRKGMGIKNDEILLNIIGMSPRTYARRKESNHTLTSIESDRLYRLAKIESHAETVFGDQATANDWLQSYNRALGFTPLEMLDTEAGTDRVERVLTRIEHGVYS
ncbi:MAG: DUF2384 domain-containing protein [Candidatus Thiodiazotropha endolucinida]|nr:DUF2384 domain-containing protein [Candidatus Thiodiazotropha endolucinida]